MIEKIKVSEIKPYENNPRKNDKAVDQVMESIKECGYISPIVIDENNVILAGHTRHKAIKKLGWDEIEVLRVTGLTEEQKKKYRLLDNKTNELAEWDYDMLYQELKGLDMSGFDIDWGIKDEEDEEPVEDNFDIDTNLPEEPKSKHGDIYILGNHRLMCGDSTSESDVDKLLDGTQIDLVVTDPPYNVDYGSKAEAINKYGYKFSDRHIENDYMPDDEFEEFLDKAFKNLERSLKEGGAFYVWHASITVYQFEKALKNNGLKTRQQLIWVKNALVLGRQDYQWIHEPCLYGWKEGAAHYFVNDRTIVTTIEDEPLQDINKLKKEQLVKILNEVLQLKQPTSVIRVDKPARSPEHPTMKPIKLLTHLIKNSSKKNETVFDLFGGSGSTMMTCEQLGRRCYTMEYDPKYVDVIVKRWEEFTGKKAILIEGDNR